MARTLTIVPAASEVWADVRLTIADYHGEDDPSGEYDALVVAWEVVVQGDAARTSTVRPVLVSPDGALPTTTVGISWHGRYQYALEILGYRTGATEGVKA